VAVVTKPFPFEGRKRMAVALEGIAELSQHVDSLIIVPNEKLLSVMGATTSLLTAFEAANNVLFGAVQGIADLIIRPGMINADFADVRTVMSEMGMAMMGTGRASGENRAREATEAALGSPLLDDVNLQGARGILVNITAGMDLSLGEYSEVGDTIQQFASENATVVIGTVIDPEMSGEIRVTLVATGLASYAAAPAAPTKVVDNTPALKRQAFAPLPPYAGLERPAVMRNQAAPTAPVTQQPVTATQTSKVDIDEDLDYLDIPAFLRRQAD
jgi:cell division protein FtsZ